MRYDTRYRPTGSSFASSIPTGVRWLLISNTALFVLYFFAVRVGFGAFFEPFQLIPSMVVKFPAIWQLGTYMFLHDPNGLMHILFNMLTLWMFGVSLEQTWGTKRFLTYYFVCGVGAAICVVIVGLLFGTANTPVIGASGAILGLLMAFGLLFPEVELLFFFLFPIKAKYYVMIVGAIVFMSSFIPSSGVSNIAHLGGMLVGYFYLRFKVGPIKLDFIGRQYKEWKLQRAKKKFQVYMRKHGSDREPWVH
jgi:membrane associated rhomboid family serine protease